MSVPRIRATAVALGIAVLVAACGGGGSDSSYKEPKGPSQQTAKIQAGNLYFKPKSVDLPAGIDTVDLVGKGGVHTLVIEKVQDFKLRVNGDGESDDLKVDLKAGKYTFYCDIPGHREAGMEGTINVT